jgi:hypothetical protein
MGRSREGAAGQLIFPAILYLNMRFFIQRTASKSWNDTNSRFQIP